ncbi:MAG TPA: gliding motility-associated ABC transporter substrate-binding protein GldG [Bacteroidales bacterium]|jgi:gliding-associated putative ABC transporter substrate-binding component GldG|nr:gliding motility-associated ABC transporter substrate-binding protein GldG [Bacteroidales bacterium]HQB36451.1 gliding motility-associated ABC transporter substrate-binding protein GldG [Bacteroidales bacterium]
MPENSNNRNIRLNSWISFFITIAGIILTAWVLSLSRIRLDLTEDKRYTLSDQSVKVLKGIKNDIYIQVYLDGEMQIPLKRLKRSVQEMLEEFRIASDRKITFQFINPSASGDEEQREAIFQDLYNKGLIPIRAHYTDDAGGTSQRLVFPGMIINYDGIEVPVNFLKNNQALSYEQNILHSIEGLEYEMIQTIATVSSDTIHKVAFLEGHGELSEVEVADITLNLSKYFTIDRGVINGIHGILDQYSAVIIAAPDEQFSEADKFVIDQYIMNGGKVLWLLEQVYVNRDSLSFGETAGFYYPLNIEDQLFRYGARINPEIIQDMMDCMLIRLSVTAGGGQRQIVPAPWIYYPLLSPNQQHPVTRNLNKVKGEFVNTIDTVGMDKSIKKTILLHTSDYSRTIAPPMFIKLQEAETVPDAKEFNKSRLTAAVLLEGVFSSAFRNRMPGAFLGESNIQVSNESLPTRMIVIADGDIIRNEVQRSGSTEIPLPLGQDKYTGQLFGNRDFLLNCVNYLVDQNDLMQLRSREMKLRLLDRAKIKDQRIFWQVLNVMAPVILVILSGLIYHFIRVRAYSKFR